MNALDKFLKRKKYDNINESIEVIDLCGGIGGFRLGLERASPLYKFVWYADIDPYCVKIYNKNFNTKYKTTNIIKMKSDEIPRCDLLCAGFPCQSFSPAGKREGFCDARGTLFFEIARILRDKKPAHFLLENVKGLLCHNKGETFTIIIQTLENLGYGVEWMVLDSQFFGVPQHRERVYIIGHFGSEPRSEMLSFRKGDAKIRQKIEICIKDKFQKQIYGINGVSPTVREGHGDAIKIYDGKRYRGLTVVELERLQGFPDGFTSGISDTRRKKLLGNAVTVPVVTTIGKSLIENIKQEHKLSRRGDEDE